MRNNCILCEAIEDSWISVVWEDRYRHFVSRFIEAMCANRHSRSNKLYVPKRNPVWIIDFPIVDPSIDYTIHCYLIIAICTHPCSHRVEEAKNLRVRPQKEKAAT